ncbi:MAG: hypothetical protein JXJ20_07440, partial [Anaerolineae bacterium]|nr:hypothetical protein [Anaerolineae bacterium]
MIKRHTLWPVLSIALILSLVAGPFTAGAQTPPPLPEVYTWEAYGFSVRYPSDWTVDEGDTVISLHPANRDVSDGTGPELVLFVQANTGADQFDTVIDAFTATINGDISEATAGTFEGYPIRVLTFDQVEPDTIGGITLIAIENQTMLGVAYTMRDNEMSLYTPIFEAMHASMTFSASLATPTGESSISIASIQLPQPYIWQETGLRL